MEEDESLEEMIAQIGRGLEAVIDTRTTDLEELQGLLVTSRLMLEQEAQRLRARHGADDPRVRRIVAGLDRQAEGVADAGDAASLSTRRPPATGAREGIVHGRVMDGAGRAVPGAVVRFVDGEGRALAATRRVEVDATGYFAATIDAALLERVQNEGGPFLVVESARGEVLSRSPEPVPLEIGHRLPVEVYLDAEATAVVRGRGSGPAGSGARTERPPEPSGEAAETVAPPPRATRPDQPPPEEE
jgi:hypothetical protein